MAELKERILQILQQPQMASLATIGPDDPNYGVLEIKPYCIEYVCPPSHKPEIWTAKQLRLASRHRLW